MLTELIIKYNSIIDILPDKVSDLDNDTYLLMRQICDIVSLLYSEAVV